MKKLLSGTLKKTAALILILLILAPAACYAAAHTDPFEKFVMSEDTELVDDTADQGVNNQPVQYVENFGIGYAYAGDCVVLRDLDFSEKQAKAISVMMANGDDEMLELSVYVGDLTADPVAIISVTPTGGFTPEDAKVFCADLEVPVEGVATIYIKWINKTGNMFEVEFFDEYFDRKEFKEDKGDHTELAPSTGDNIVVFAVLTVSAIFAVALIYRKRVIYKVKGE